MGLLDQFSNLSPEQTQGLLAAASQMLQQSGPSRMPTSFGQVLGGGLGAYQGAMTEAKMRKQQEEQQALQKQIMGMTIRDKESDYKEQERGRSEAARYQEFMRGAGNPEVQAFDAKRQFLGGDMRPTVENAAKLDQMPQQAQQGGLYDQLMSKAQKLQAAGFPSQAEAAMKEAIQARPKFANEPRTVMGPNGKPMLVQMADDGTVRPIQGGYGLAEKMHFQDTGGGYAGIGEYSGDVKTSGVKTETADGRLNRLQAERHFREGQTTPQYMETSEGIMALPKKLAPGQLPTGQLVMGANGEPIQKKQNIPQYVVEGVVGNAKSLASINAALKSLDAPGGKDAVGWKGYLPNAALNRMYPEGTETRANISDVGSLVLHDRSGAAVTAAESPRLMPFIPLATDDAATVKKKLARFKQAFESETNNLTFQFPGAKKLAEHAAQQELAPSAGGASADWDRNDNVVNFGDLK